MVTKYLTSGRLCYKAPHLSAPILPCSGKFYSLFFSTYLCIHNVNLISRSLLVIHIHECFPSLP